MSGFGDPLFLHPRVSGNRRRGWGLIALSVALVVLAFVGIDVAERMHVKDDWPAALLLTIIPAACGVWLGVVELKRPIQMDASGRCRSRRIEGAALRWHATFPDLADEVRVVMERTSSSRGAGMAEMIRGRLEARIVFDRSPLKTGTRTRMRFSAKAERSWFVPEAFEFRLRCLRESPTPLLAFRSGIECLADLEPVTIELDAAKSVYFVEFDLPTGLPASELLAERPVYWEVTVDGHGTFAGMRGRLFIPVTP